MPPATINGVDGSSLCFSGRNSDSTSCAHGVNGAVVTGYSNASSNDGGGWAAPWGLDTDGRIGKGGDSGAPVYYVGALEGSTPTGGEPTGWAVGWAVGATAQSAADADAARGETFFQTIEQVSHRSGSRCGRSFTRRHVSAGSST